MGEIEKLYDTVGIRPRRKCEFYEDCPYGFGHSCDNCDIEFTEFNSSYPPFTAEKQLELIKWLLDSICLLNLKRLQFSENFENDLAGLINELWQDMTDEEKQEIREILE